MYIRKRTEYIPIINQKENHLEKKSKYIQPDQAIKAKPTTWEKTGEKVSNLVDLPQNISIPKILENILTRGYKLLPSTMDGKIEAILRKQRQLLAKSMKDYVFHPKLKAR